MSIKAMPVWKWALLLLASLVLAFVVMVFGKETPLLLPVGWLRSVAAVVSSAAMLGHLITRINLFLHNDVFTTALGINHASGMRNIIDVINEFLLSNDRILRLGFEVLPFEFSVREVIVNFIAGHLLKEARKHVF